MTQRSMHPGLPHGRRRYLLALIGTALAALTALTGCGVPDSGPPVVVSSAPPGAGGDLPPAQHPDTIRPPEPSSASDPRDLVRLFLTAAGADPHRTQANVEKFFTPSAQGSWHVDRAGLTLVRVKRYTTVRPQDARNSQRRVQVRVTGEVIGVLNADGAVQAAPTGRSGYDRTFTVKRVDVDDETEWRIANPPSKTLLSAAAMAADYQPYPVYFTSPDHRRLVPELRYMWDDTPTPQRRTVLVDWLLDGPSAWLGQAAGTAVPEGTQRRGNVITDQDVVVVNLTSEAADSTHRGLLSAQLAWTLRSVVSRLQVQVEGRPLKVRGVSGTVHGWQTWKRFNAASLAADSAGYYVSSGRLAAIGSARSMPLVLSAVRSRSINSRIVSAALSVHSANVAVVRTRANGRPELWLGETTGADQARASYSQAAGLDHADSIGRPSFLPSTPTAVVPVDGSLKLVSSKGTAGTVGFQDRVLHGVSVAVVAPSGGRIAVIADGALYIAPLAWDAEARKATIGRPRRVASMFTNLTDVAWTQDGSVVFGGRGSAGEESALSGGVHSGAWEFSVDGVTADLLTGPEVDTVPSGVASATGDPSNVSSHGSILLSADNEILQVSGNEAIPPAGARQSPRGTAPFFPS